jgi:hypothetical protein
MRFCSSCSRDLAPTIGAVTAGRFVISGSLSL